MVGKIVMIAGTLAVAIAGGAGCFLASGGSHREPGADGSKFLTGDDFGRMRREALGVFPRGSRVADAVAGLTSIGFLCAPARHLVANINAPSVQCDSAGRGYPTSSRMQVTIMARSGTVSDIAIGNGFDPYQADARTPDPNPGGKVTFARIAP